jgi:hypothetical protein
MSSKTDFSFQTIELTPKNKIIRAILTNKNLHTENFKKSLPRDISRSELFERYTELLKMTEKQLKASVKQNTNKFPKIDHPAYKMFNDMISESRKPIDKITIRLTKKSDEKHRDELVELFSSDKDPDEKLERVMELAKIDVISDNDALKMISQMKSDTADFSKIKVEVRESGLNEEQQKEKDIETEIEEMEEGMEEGLPTKAFGQDLPFRRAGNTFTDRMNKFGRFSYYDRRKKNLQ